MRFTPKKFEKFKKQLEEKGYIEYHQDFNMSDYVFWKSFDRNENREKGYSVGFAVYDMSKYTQYTAKDNISISFEFMLGNKHNVDRLDLTVSDEKITIEQFEQFCKKLYDFYKENNIN